MLNSSWFYDDQLWNLYQAFCACNWCPLLFPNPWQPYSFHHCTLIFNLYFHVFPSPQYLPWWTSCLFHVCFQNVGFQKMCSMVAHGNRFYVQVAGLGLGHSNQVSTLPVQQHPLESPDMKARSICAKRMVIPLKYNGITNIIATGIRRNPYSGLNTLNLSSTNHQLPLCWSFSMKICHPLLMCSSLSSSHLYLYYNKEQIEVKRLATAEIMRFTKLGR